VPADVPGIAQYVEEVPTATGPVQNSGGTRTRSELSPQARERLRRSAGQEAAALEEIVTGSPPRAKAQAVTRPAASTPEAAASLPDPGDDSGHLILLLVGIPAITVAVVLAGVFRRKLAP
jgi:hypothetical protein